MNIAIDGPAGAGKSTIAKLVAKATDSIYVDTGAMYRALALYFIKKKISPKDQKSVEGCLDDIDITVSYQDGVQHVFLNGEDVTDSLRKEEVGNMASVVSADAKVREKLVSLQQKLAKKTSVVMDGRDIGTVVLPDAEVKIYLTASAHTRALRRYKELAEKEEAKGSKALKPVEEALDIDRIEQDIKERDERDMNRKNSPLKKADDAVVVDSSEMTIDEVVIRILDIVGEKTKEKGPLVHEDFRNQGE
jgi:cytidylate kinase